MKSLISAAAFDACMAAVPAWAADTGQAAAGDTTYAPLFAYSLGNPHARQISPAVEQADAMKAAGVPIDFVLEIQVPDQDIITRMSGRRAHIASGRTYHVVFNPPKVEGIDDVTGEPLVQRDDDREEVVRKRLDVYHSQTRPLVEYYSGWAQRGEPGAPKYRAISGVGPVDEVKQRAFDALA